MIRLLLVTLLLALPLTGLAELPPQLKADFAPLQGYLVMPVDDQFLIDLDARKGLHSGDILSIVEPGEKIIHPVSGEVLGRLDGRKTFLQVSQLKSGYSYARQLDAGPAAQKGQQLTRFMAVPSLFVATAGQATKLKHELENALPHLDWQTSASENTALLIFELTTTGLLVKDATGQLLNSYPMPQLSAVATKSATPLSAQALIPAIAPVSKALVSSAAIIRSNNNSPIWHSAKIAEHPIAIIASDLNQNGLIETVILTRKQLRVLRISKEQTETLATYKIGSGQTVIALDSLDLDHNGQPELYLSVLINDKPSSIMFELQGAELKVIESRIPFLLRQIELPDEGKILIGQKRYEAEFAFSGHPFRMQLDQHGLSAKAPLKLPAQLNIYGFSPLPTDNQQALFAALSDTDYLKVRNLQEIIWESADYFGGSETSYQMTPEASKEASFPYFIPARITVNSNAELLIVQNEGPRTTRRFRMYNKGRLIALKWNGMALEESWRTADQSGYFADFTLADIDNDGQLELAAFVLFKHGSLFSKPAASVVIYELQ